nr:helix-turn-helix domain-containing protein [Streptomyces sp. SID3343]
MRGLRTARGLSLAGLAPLVHYSKGYLSKVENGEKPMSAEIARNCDRALQTGGLLTSLVSRSVPDSRSVPGSRSGTSAPDASPYPGLAAFEVRDAPWFFGRDSALAQLLARLAERLDDSGPVTVVACSGAGKSSLLQAGLVPAVRRGALPATGSRDWPVVVLRPGEHPLAELSARCSAELGVPSAEPPDSTARPDPSTPAEMSAEALVGKPAGTPAGTSAETFVESLARILDDGSPDPPRPILIVDQFEETFTLCRDPDERAAFVRVLHALTVGPRRADGRAGRGALVVIGLRADFYGHCLAFPELVAALRDGQVPLEPMSRHEIRAAVTRPAEVAGLELEPGLVELVLRDLASHDIAPTAQPLVPGADEPHAHEPGALPLLAHALLATWQHRGPGVLTVAGYQRTGGIAGAVGATAERTWSTLTQEEQESARPLLTALTCVDATHRATRRRVSRERLVDDSCTPGGPEVAARILEAFSRARLVTAHVDGVTLAHEALLNAWPRLRGWLETDRADLLLAQRLGEAAEEWRRAGHERALLLRGSRLASARELTRRRRVPESERAFVDASTADEVAEGRAARRRTRRGRATVVLTVLLLTALCAGFVVVNRQRQAVADRRVALSNELASRAIALGSTRPETSMALAAAAFRQARTPTARAAVLRSQAQTYAGRLDAGTGSANTIAWSPTAPLVAAGSVDGRVRLWNPTTRATVGELPSTGIYPLRCLAFSSDGSVLATGDSHGRVTVWDIAQRRVLFAHSNLEAHQGAVAALKYARDGHLVSVGEDGILQLWSRLGQTLERTLRDSSGPLADVDVAADGPTAVTAGLDGNVHVWDLVAGTSRVLPGRHGRIRAVALSPDGTTVATGEWLNAVGLWNLTTGRREAELTGHADSIFDVEFSSDGRRLAVAGQDETADVWDVDARLRLVVLTGHTGPVRHIVFSPSPSDGVLATSGLDGVRLWRTGGDVATTRPMTPWLGMDVSPDLATLATAGANGTVNLWDTHSRQPSATLTVVEGASAAAPTSGFTPVDAGTGAPGTVPPGAVRVVAFDAGGTRLAAGTQDGRVSVWEVPTRRRIAQWRASELGITALAFAPAAAGDLVATGGEDHRIGLWGSADGHRIRDLPEHPEAVQSLLFLDPETLVSGSEDNTARLTDIHTGRVVRTLADHRDSVLGLALSPDRATLATAGRDQTLRVWNPATGAQRRRPLTGHTAPVTSAAFSPDGHTLVSTARDHTVRLWDLKQGRAVTLSGHTNRVRGVRFLDESTLVSAAEDGTVRWWDLRVEHVLGEICAVIGKVDRKTWAAASPDIPFAPGCA